MTQVTAAMIKELREKSGAGMLDCKKALEETQGDFEAAIDWLRTKGLSTAAKKSGRTAAEGLVAVALAEGNKRAVVVELNSETDFVARNEQFQNLVMEAAQVAAQTGANSADALGAQTAPNGKTVSENITEAIATIGENMALRRVEALEVSEGVVANYMHNAVAPNLGKIGVLVALESSAPADVLNGLGKQIAMHIAAARPEFLSIESVDADALERERTVLTEQAREGGKAEEFIGKMVEGRIRKYYEEVVLLEQKFVMDGETKISDVIANAAKEAGAPIALKGFSRFELGAGIEREENDFAAEVAKAVGG